MRTSAWNSSNEMVLLWSRSCSLHGDEKGLCQDTQPECADTARSGVCVKQPGLCLISTCVSSRL